MKYFVAVRNLTGIVIMAAGALAMLPGVLVLALGACLTGFFQVERI